MGGWDALLLEVEGRRACEVMDFHETSTEGLDSREILTNHSRYEEHSIVLLGGCKGPLAKRLRAFNEPVYLFW